MNDGGIFVSGYFCGCEERESLKNDVRIKSYHYLIVCGNDAYKVKSDHDYRYKLSFGDQVDFKVRLNAFNNVIYMNGELWEDGQDS